MRNIFCFFFTLGISVSVAFLTQDVAGTPKTPEEELVTKSSETFEDYEDPTAHWASRCHSEQYHCEATFNYIPKPICVYKKNLGLTNYFGLCTIRFQQCLTAQQKKLHDKSISLDDEIYHNGKYMGCQYYAEHANSEKQGIIWYFKLGGLDAETEEITQPFENIV